MNETGELKTNTPLLTVVRGFPGSGKTTFGRELAAKQNGLFVEPDMFLYKRDNSYQYTKEDFKVAITKAHKVLVSFFQSGGTFAVYADVLPKLVDVSWFIWDVSSTVGIIKGRIQGPDEHKYIDFEVIDMPKITMEESKVRNDHNVCEEDLKRMFAEWEDWTDNE